MGFELIAEGDSLYDLRDNASYYEEVLAGEERELQIGTRIEIGQWLLDRVQDGVEAIGVQLTAPIHWDDSVQAVIIRWSPRIVASPSTSTYAVGPYRTKELISIASIVLICIALLIAVFLFWRLGKVIKELTPWILAALAVAAIIFLAMPKEKRPTSWKELKGEHG